MDPDGALRARLPIWALLLLLAALAASRLVAARRVVPYDSTFVTCRLAANAARGDGLRYNPGEGADLQPDLVLESPLQVGLLAAAARIGWEPGAAAGGLNLLAELLAVTLLACHFARRPALVWLVVTGLVAWPLLARVSLGGASAPIALALAAASLSAGAWRASFAAGALGILAGLARPEAALCLIPAVRWRRWRRDPALAGALFVAAGAWGVSSLWPAFLSVAWLPSLDAARSGYLLAAGALWLLALLLERPLSSLVTRSPRALVPACAGPLTLAAATLGVLGQSADRDALAERVWRPLRNWSREVRQAEGPHHLLASELGTAGWFVGGVVLDAGREPAVVARRLGEREAEFVLLRARPPEILGLRSSGDLARSYYPIERFSVEGWTDLEPDLADLSEGGAADYLLFRRRP